jgi:predicted DNA-binding protein with PD1-like motif
MLAGLVDVQAQEKVPNRVAIKLQDQVGDVLPDGHVKVVPLGEGRSSELRTDGTGTAYFDGPPGTYQLIATVTGYKAVANSSFDVTGASQAVTLVMPISETYVGPVRVGPSPPIELTTEHFTQRLEEDTISPARPIPTGQAPGMKVKLVGESKGGEKVYAVIFSKGDEVLSGLTDFAIQYKIGAAHFTGIGAISGATVGWLDLSIKAYRPIHVDQQVEVLSMIGDVATFNGKPIVHAHLVMGRQDGSTVGGHLWEAHVNPTLEVFVSVDAVGLKKKADDASGMKLIDPTQ